MIRAVVVFPEPDSPTIASEDPALTSNEIPLIANASLPQLFHSKHQRNGGRTPENGNNGPD